MTQTCRTCDAPEDEWDFTSLLHGLYCSHDCYRANGGLDFDRYVDREVYGD